VLTKRNANVIRNQHSLGYSPSNFTLCPQGCHEK